MTNKCVSCIKDNKTGECYDVKDKVARQNVNKLTETVNDLTEKVNEIKENPPSGGTKLYRYGFWLMIALEMDEGVYEYMPDNQVTFISLQPYINFDIYNAASGMLGFNFDEVIYVDGYITVNDDYCPIVSLKGDELTYLKNGQYYTIYGYDVRLKEIVEEKGILADHVLDWADYEVKKMGSTYIMEGREV